MTGGKKLAGIACATAMGLGFQATSTRRKRKRRQTRSCLKNGEGRTRTTRAMDDGHGAPSVHLEKVLGSSISHKRGLGRTRGRRHGHHSSQKVQKHILY